VSSEPGAFNVSAEDPDSFARSATLVTAHGVVKTPVFMPVGTQGTVKAVSRGELEELGTQIILGNTYHLFVRPGSDVIGTFGSLHRFSNWPHPILTDSGGFQVFSLAKLRKITGEGVHFNSHLDGASMFIGPETSMEIQAVLGSDIAMLFDECPPYPCEQAYARESLDRTLAWAKKCRSWVDANRPATDNGLRQLHFGIVQGSVYRGMREECARELVDMDFDGYAVGGLSVGEPEEELYKAVDAATPLLPTSKPRYAMGLGTPPQLLELVARGIDMFDCVMPTRVARNGGAFTGGGLLNLKNQKFQRDPSPIEGGCGCPACSGGFARGYIRHLVKSEEILGLRLISLHNLHFYLHLMRRAREAITEGTFSAFRREFTSAYRGTQSK
jgi:queuine tRNA-ribosyltransferase